MSFKSLLTDRCDIFHLRERTFSPGYGVTGEEIEFYYENEPDLTGIPCKFTERTQTITQGEPGAEIIHVFSITFEKDVNVRLNDKLVFEGAEFKAQVPRKVKNHHIRVTAIRRGAL